MRAVRAGSRSLGPRRKGGPGKSGSWGVGGEEGAPTFAEQGQCMEWKKHCLTAETRDSNNSGLRSA